MWNDASDTTDKVIPALQLALGEMTDVTKDARVNAGSLRYTYATLGAVLEVTRPLLAKHGLAIMQTAASSAEGPCVHTTLLHSSGQWLSTPPLLIKPQQATPQAVGSAISFARRYAILAVLGIATEDDDGHAAATPARQQPRPEPQYEEPERQQTEAEKQVRQIVRDLPDPMAREDFQADFKEYFGSTLTNLSEARHEEALTWAMEWVGRRGFAAK